MIRIISLGAGVQSTALALMAAAGEIGPMPDAAIFADTGAEPAGVYQHLDALEKLLPFPVYRVSAGDLGADVLAGYASKTKRTSSPPFYTRTPDGKLGMLPRQCTKEYKIQPIIKKVRELLGLEFRQRGGAVPLVEQWIGISTDEAHRMKPAEQRWITNRWPLIDAGLSRRNCIAWLERDGRCKPVKSACIWCPYHDNDLWRDMRDRDTPSWDTAVAFDRAIRPGGRGMTGEAFVHRSGVPLDQVDLRTWAERGQPDLFGPDPFGEECDAVCAL